MSRPCLPRERIKEIEEALKEIESRDDDPKYKFLETLDPEESQEALDNLINKLGG